MRYWAPGKWIVKAKVLAYIRDMKSFLAASVVLMAASQACQFYWEYRIERSRSPRSSDSRKCSRVWCFCIGHCRVGPGGEKSLVGDFLPGSRRDFSCSDSSRILQLRNQHAKCRDSVCFGWVFDFDSHRIAVVDVERRNFTERGSVPVKK
jgi:hypothetical protein